MGVVLLLTVMKKELVHFKNYTDDIPDEVKQERLDYLMRIQERSLTR